jgi:hypothetical protein
MCKPRSILSVRSEVMLLMDVDLVDLPGSCTDEPFPLVELAIRVLPAGPPGAGLFDAGVFHGLWHAGEDWFCLQSLTRLTQVDRP